MSPTRLRRGRLIAFAAFTFIVTWIAFGPSVSGMIAAAVGSTPQARLAALGLKFDGARTCGGSKCHGKDGSDYPPKEIGHEFTIWDAGDKHAKAYETLTNDESGKIAKSLGLAKATEAAECLSCHALNVDAKLAGSKFNIKEGNTCGSCHGPSEKWLEPHQTAGWTQKQRDAAKSNTPAGHDSLLKTTGLYDTKPLIARAQICVGCHLAIDDKLVKAGHPQPTFELYDFQERENKHWVDPDGYFGTKIWMSGQVVCAQEAFTQLATRAAAKADAEVVKDAAHQALAHGKMLATAATAIGADAAKLTAVLDTIAKAATDPASKAAELQTSATAAAAAAKEFEAKINAFDPAAGKAPTAALLAALSKPGLTTGLGNFGMDQQASAILSLYSSYASAEKVADSAVEGVKKTIEEKLFPPEKGELTPEQFEKNLPDVAAKLPK